MTSTAATKPVSSLGFNSPFFCENGKSETKGRIVRIPSDVTITGLDQDIPLKAGEIVFKSANDNSLSFYSPEEFKNEFSRLLGNGKQVALTETVAAQMAMANSARDTMHFEDAMIAQGLVLKGMAGEITGELVGAAKNTQFAKDVSATTNDIRTQISESAQQMVASTRGAVASVTESELGKKARATLSSARNVFGGIFSKKL